MKGFGNPKQPTEKEVETFKCRYRDKLKLKYGSKTIDDLLADDPDRFFQLADLLGLISDHERLLGRVYPVRHEETARRIKFVIANDIAMISHFDLSNRERLS
jgi:hypothetical protein